MLLLTGKTLQETLRDFNIESWRVNALNYNEFLNSDFYKGHSIMDVLYELQKVVKYSRRTLINKRLTSKTNIDLVLEFYKKLELDKDLEVILSGKHPMFKTIIDKKSPSQVVHKGDDPQLEFSVGDTGTIDGAVNLAHESAHAINGHHEQLQILLSKQNEVLKNFGKDSEEFKRAKKERISYLREQQNIAHDCVSETETLIIELLFLDYMVEKNSISPEDKQLYINLRNNSFRNSLKIMFQEDIIYSKIREIKKEKDCHLANLNEEEYKELCKRLQKNSHYKEIMNSFFNISNRRKPKNKWHSSYVFRYVVGEIISTVWYDKYISLNKKEKQQMIQDLKIFIKNNDKFNLDDAMNLLLKGETYETVICKFVKHYNVEELSI